MTITGDTQVLHMRVKRAKEGFLGSYVLQLLSFAVFVALIYGAVRWATLQIVLDTYYWNGGESFWGEPDQPRYLSFDADVLDWLLGVVVVTVAGLILGAIIGGIWWICIETRDRREGRSYMRQYDSTFYRGY